MGGVNHGGVVDCGEVAVHQVKVVQAQHGGPDGLDLHVGKVLPDATVTAWRDKKQELTTVQFGCGLTQLDVLDTPSNSVAL